MRVFYCSKPVNMQLSFDGLIAVVDEYIRQDSRSGACFVFFAKNRKMLKVLHWEGDGFSLWCKRLEKGRFQVPQTLSGDIILTYEELLKYLALMNWNKDLVKRQKMTYK